MSQWTRDQMPRMEDTTVVITGANSGLGYEATDAFARRGATVVMAVRSRERGRDAAESIRAAADGPAETDMDLDIRICDLADLSSVESFAQGVREEYETVDILCNNAGVMAIPQQETADGFEMQLGVNHFGHFALTAQLFPMIRAGERDSRIITQSSGAHQTGSMDFSDLNWTESYGKWQAYGRSKLANLLFAYELQRRLDDSGIETVRSIGCHPGYADTNLQMRTAEESGNPLVKLGMRLGNRLLAQSPEMGALPMLYAATTDVDGGSYVGPGGLFDMRGYPAIVESNDASHDQEDAQTLWARSEEATGVDFPLESPPSVEENPPAT
ncbi:MAG: dehydrogenase [uncultured archaeon A07HR60]|nr:MAG: dehydrogenase [uncultured archaeon A07HR60]